MIHMNRPFDISRPSRPNAFTFRNMVLAGAVASTLALGGFGGYVYYRNNSPSQLALRAQLALEQQDSARAIAFLQRALDKNPAPETAAGLKLLMARALMDAGRESDARDYLQQLLAENPTKPEALDLVAQSYVNPAWRTLRRAPKPLSETAANDLYAIITADVASLQKLPHSPANLIAEAQLHRLHYYILTDQAGQASAARDTATLNSDQGAASQAQEHVNAVKAPTARERDLAVSNLEAALKADPKSTAAANLLAQYLYQDSQFPAVLALHDRMKQAGALSDDVVLSAARAHIADAQRRPDTKARLVAAQALLEAYLADHPKNVRILASLGDVLLDQGDVAAAAKLGERAAAESPNDLTAQILLVNCRLREKKTDDALKLITPLTTTHAGRAEVWYLLGVAQSDAGDAQNAENSFRKALAVNPGFTQARQALLSQQIKAGNIEAAANIATLVLREDRYDMAAWDVTLDSLRKRGQTDRARTLLISLAGDPGLPQESRPELVRLLSEFGAAQQAQALLATLPQDEKSTLRLRAFVAASAGNAGEARILMAKAIAADPQDIDLRLKYIALLSGAGANAYAADIRDQLDQITAAKKGLNADQSVAMARAYLNIRLPQQALALLKPLTEKQPPQVEARALAQQAQALLAGNTQTAPTIVSADLQNSSVLDLTRAAQATLQQKNYTETLRLARAGLAREKTNVALRQLSALAFKGLNQTEQAVNEVIEAARAQPGRPDAFATFVQLFPTSDAAIKGIGYGSRIEPINPAFGAWALGQLAEISGQFDLALRYYTAGLAAADRTPDPRPARDQLFQSILNLHAERKDIASLKKAADSLAGSDTTFLPGIRLLAADHLLALGDRDGAAQQLDLIVSRLGNAGLTSPSPRLVLGIATRLLSLGKADQARALMEKQVAAAPNQPDLLDAYATLLLQSKDYAKAVDVRSRLITLDAGNPEYRVALAFTHAAAGDLPAAFRTLDDTAGLGATGKQIATAARLRLLITLGLLNQAQQELQANAAGPAADDSASRLAVAQAWSQLNKPQDARAMAAAIPAYAAEYPDAQLLLASLDLTADKPADAVATLESLRKKFSAAIDQIAPKLFVAYLRANNAAAALDLAVNLRAQSAENSAGWRTWTSLSATAAREGKQFDKAAALLNELDPAARKAAALDIALMQILQGAPATDAIAQLPDATPAYARTTLQLLAGGTIDAGRARVIAADGSPSAFFAALAATPAAGRAALAADASRNTNLFQGDIDLLLKELGTADDAGAKLRKLALVQRLLESGWTTTALDRLAEFGDAGPTWAAVSRHQALTDLHRYAEANKIRDQFTAANKQDANISPSVRLLLAASWTRDERYPDALAVLEPLAPLNRPDVLTSIATLHEKIGGAAHLEKAIALHRQVRRLDPSNIAAANNLAYTLAAAHPADKAALAQARKSIEFAIQKSPEITAFQDTLGWIQILSGEAADGTRRLAQAVPSLRLEPAIHYHLGVGYARTGQNDLARMHLLNVAQLARDHQEIPELTLATEALRSLASVQ